MGVGQKGEKEVRARPFQRDLAECNLFTQGRDGPRGQITRLPPEMSRDILRI